MTNKLSLEVNGVRVEQQVEPDQLLVDFIRQNLALTGTHVGCDTGQCGACTIHLDGRAIKACNMLAIQADGRSITTIEGISQKDGSMHPMQQAFKQCHGLQCGFCTPGMVMSSIDLVENHKVESEAHIRDSLDGNMCRCTGYHNIVKAVAAGAKAMQG
jgi:carbon-monoxide dehydrogenase small subunit